MKYFAKHQNISTFTTKQNRIMKKTIANFLGLFLLTFTLMFVSCNDSQDNGISTLEKELKKNPDRKTQDSLLSAYSVYIHQNPDNPEIAAEYQFKIANLNQKIGRSQIAVNTLLKSIRQYPNAKNTPNNLTLLGAIFQNSFKKHTQAQAVFEYMITNYPDHPLTADVKKEVKKGLPPLDTVIAKTAREMYNQEAFRVNRTAVNNYVEACELYALTNPGKNASADYLFKAAEMARTNRQYPKALDIYDWIYNDYKEHKKHQQALFLKAFTLDNELKQPDEAKAIYETFLEKYPDDDFADDTQFLLTNLGKPDTEIIESFDKK